MDRTWVEWMGDWDTKWWTRCLLPLTTLSQTHCGELDRSRAADSLAVEVAWIQSVALDSLDPHDITAFACGEGTHFLIPGRVFFCSATL